MTPADRARELARQINETTHFDKGLLGLGHWAINILQTESILSAALQREREEAAERVRNSPNAYDYDHDGLYIFDPDRVIKVEDAIIAILADQSKEKP
jgi:hypothetical protein